METVEKAVAKALMDVKAVLLRPESPFTWASGWKSPIYCDNRKLLSYPEIRENICRWMADIMGMVAIFSYNFPQARKAFEDANVELTTLSNYDTLVEVASETGYIKESDIEVLKQWRFSPSTWGKNE